MIHTYYVARVNNIGNYFVRNLCVQPTLAGVPPSGSDFNLNILLDLFKKCRVYYKAYHVNTSLVKCH